MVFRVYVEKKPGFDVEAQQLAGELRTILGLTGLKALRIVNRYDVEGISQELFDQTVPTVFSEPQVDNVAYDLPDFAGAKVFATEFLPGQFDQRADSAAECIQLISQGERPALIGPEGWQRVVDRVVIAAGAWSKPLAAAMGAKLAQSNSVGYVECAAYDVARLSTAEATWPRTVASEPRSTRPRSRSMVRPTSVVA